MNTMEDVDFETRLRSAVLTTIRTLGGRPVKRRELIAMLSRHLIAEGGALSAAEFETVCAHVDLIAAGGPKR